MNLTLKLCLLVLLLIEGKQSVAKLPKSIYTPTMIALGDYHEYSVSPDFERATREARAARSWDFEQ